MNPVSIPLTVITGVVHLFGWLID